MSTRTISDLRGKFARSSSIVNYKISLVLLIVDLGWFSDFPSEEKDWLPLHILTLVCLCVDKPLFGESRNTLSLSHAILLKTEYSFQLIVTAIPQTRFYSTLWCDFLRKAWSTVGKPWCDLPSAHAHKHIARVYWASALMDWFFGLLKKGAWSALVPTN